MDEKVLKFCEEHDLNPEDLEEEIVEALEEGEEVIICEKCGEPTLEEEAYKCDECGKVLCEQCFGDPTAETECRDCLSNYM